MKREGYQQADSLVAKSKDGLSRIAATAAADQLRKETDNRAAQIVREADQQANSLLAEARKQAGSAGQSAMTRPVAAADSSSRIHESTPAPGVATNGLTSGSGRHRPEENHG